MGFQKSSHVLRAVMFIVIGLLFTRSMSAQEQEHGHWTMSISSSQDTENSWESTCELTDIEGYEKRPGDELLSKVIVEWQKPELDPLGNICTISGRLVYPNAITGIKEPVRWIQGVLVHLATSPKVNLDWSSEIDEENTVQDNGVIDARGQFRLKLSLEEVAHDRRVEEPFQFGLVLATHTELENGNQRVVWSSKDPAIPNSVVMLEIPKEPKIDRELELINAARGWPFDDPNGVKLIRAVNALQPLGKDKSLKILERYIDLLNESRLPQSDDESEIVFWIILTLFEPIRIDETIPPPMILTQFDDNNLTESARWSVKPMAVIGDIPFMMGFRMGGSTGISGVPEDHILWARRHGVIRDTLLTPTMDPWMAADALVESNRFSQIHEHLRAETEALIKLQAAAMTAYVPGVADEFITLKKRVWRQRMNEAVPVRVQHEYRWNPQSESFNKTED